MKKPILIATTLLTALCVSGQPTMVQAAQKQSTCPSNIQIKLSNLNTCLPNDLRSVIEKYLAENCPNLQLSWNQSCNGPSCDQPSGNDQSCNGPSCDQPSGNDQSCNGPSCNQPSGNDQSCNGPNCDGGQQDASLPDDTPADTEQPCVDCSDNAQEISAEKTYEEQVVDLVNAERAKAGLPALKTDATLQSAALARAKETVQLFSHTRPNGTSCFTILKEFGISYRSAGENIAYGQRSPEEVVNAWMNSEGHRANILNKNFTTIGIGYYQAANGTKYWSQLFLS